MSYTPPPGNAADFSFQGQLAYSAPAGGAADFAFEPPAAFVTVSGTLPGLTAAIAVGSVGSVIDADFIGELPPPTLTTFVVPRNDAAVVAQLPGLALVAEGAYFSFTSRPTVGQRATSFQQAAPSPMGRTTGQQDSPALPAGQTTAWQTARPAPEGIEHRLPDVFVRSPVERQGRHQDARREHDSAQFIHQEASRAVRKVLNDAFENAALLRQSAHFRHQDGDRTKRSSQKTGYQDARPVRRGHGSDFQSAAPHLIGLRGRYQEAVPPPIGRYTPPGPPEPPACYEPSADLVFGMPSASNGTNFVFICDYWTPPEPGAEPVVVPVKRVYIVVNNLALRRTSDNAVVPAFNFSLSLDVASWTWGFSASLPATAQALVEPTTGPVELSAWVNGQEFRVLAEQVGRERAFGQASISISGRGRNAMLDAPYAPVTTFDNAAGARTHQQLFDDVLTFNGVPLGYTIDYGLEAWNVPQGVWSHQGTYISALNALVQAGGAYLIPHPSALSFKVRHLYPVKPWEWSTVTPDFVLPASVVTREGLAWKEKPAYNRVFVSGQEQGVLGQVTRQGTAGDILAPMVTDPLITTAAAARQRGLAVLGDTGRQIEHTLRLPVLAETGVIQPGAFIEYEDNGASRIGIVRSTQVEARMPDVWQTLGVEVHDA